MLWEELNWMEFEKLVPEKYDTVILPVGTMEAHGVAPIGTPSEPDGRPRGEAERHPGELPGVR